MKKLTFEQEVVVRIKQTQLYCEFSKKIGMLVSLVQGAYCENTDEVTFCCRTIDLMKEKQARMFSSETIMYKQIAKEIQNRREVNNGCSHTKEQDHV